jgi:hypothetical protein
MVFEIGKYYKHTTGTYLHVLCEQETTMYGNTLIAECAGYKVADNFIAVGRDTAATANWQETTREDWMKNFS